MPRLVQISPAPAAGPPRTVDITTSGAWIGRDPAVCTLVIDESHAEVSRRHVWVGQRGGVWVAKDASSFGTRISGASMSGEVPLHNGDVLDLPHGISIRFEMHQTPQRRAPASQAAARNLAVITVLAIALAMVSLFVLSPSLRTAGIVMPWVHQDTDAPTSDDDDHNVVSLRADPLDTAVRELLSQLRAEPYEGIIPKAFLASVRHELVGRVRDKTTYCQMLRWRPVLSEELAKVAVELGEPPERIATFVYLPYIESGYKHTACSPAKARGMWQFIMSSWKRFGGKVGARDHRCHWREATAVAASHLAANFSTCPAELPLSAIAAYNVRLSRACKTCEGRNCDAFDFAPFYSHARLPEETRNYVPRFVAAWLMGEYPDIALAEAQRIRPSLQFPSQCPPPAPIPAPTTCLPGC